MGKIAPVRYRLTDILQMLKEARKKKLLRTDKVLTINKLAEIINAGAKSSAFRNKLFDAKKYGIIDISVKQDFPTSEIKLTEFGSELLDAYIENSNNLEKLMLKAYRNDMFVREIIDKFTTIPTVDDIKEILKKHGISTERAKNLSKQLSKVLEEAFKIKNSLEAQEKEKTTKVEIKDEAEQYATYTKTPTNITTAVLIIPGILEIKIVNKFTKELALKALESYNPENNQMLDNRSVSSTTEEEENAAKG